MRDRAWPCRAPCFAFDDFPFTVGDRDDQTCAADEITTPEKGVHWAMQACHTSPMDRLRMCEVKNLQWQRLQGLQDATV